jgi:hypothetical protein
MIIDDSLACWPHLSYDINMNNNELPTCDFEISDGNVDDPSYAYCGHRAGHAGDHGEWQM